MTKLYQKFLEGLDKKSKKFHLFRGSEHHQELDLETVRNIIVNKISKLLAQKMNRPVEEVEDNIRLREIKQGGATGNYFSFKYSVYNRPLMPWYTTLEPNDLFDYMKPGFDVTKHDDPDKKDDEKDTTDSEDEEDIDSDIKNDDDEEKVHSDIDSLDSDEEDDDDNEEDELTTEPDDSLYDSQVSESNIMKSFNKFRKSNIINLSETINENYIKDVDQYVLKSMELQKKERMLQNDKKQLENLLASFKGKNLYDMHNMYKSYLKKKGADEATIRGVSSYTPQQINDLIKNDITTKEQEIQQSYMDRSAHQDTVSPSVRRVGDFIDPNKSTLVQKWRNRGNKQVSGDTKGKKGIPHPKGMVKDPRTGKMVSGGVGSTISGALDTYAPGVKPITKQAGEVAKQAVSPLVWGTGKMLGKLIGKGLSTGYNKITGKGE